MTERPALGETTEAQFIGTLGGVLGREPVGALVLVCRRDALKDMVTTRKMVIIREMRLERN